MQNNTAMARREGSSFFLQKADGRCRFVMVTDKRWEGIEEQLK